MPCLPSRHRSKAIRAFNIRREWLSWQLCSSAHAFSGQLFVFVLHFLFPFILPKKLILRYIFWNFDLWINQHGVQSWWLGGRASAYKHFLRDMHYQKIVNKLWQLIDNRAELDLRSTTTFWVCMVEPFKPTTFFILLFC